MLVSVSFAFGPSAAKYFDGMLLILARRPYDLGDRIIISNPQTVADSYDTARDSWFVEDINLFTTTLRRGSDSTVATINNSSIALLKIVNCQRSPNAVVLLELKFNIRMHSEGKIIQFEAAVEEYIQANPRTWDSLKFLILTELSKDWESATYQLSAVHRLGWQDAVKISKSRAALVAFCGQTARELEVLYWTPIPKRTFFYGGMLQNVPNVHHNPPPPPLGSLVLQQGGEGDAVDTTSGSSSDAMHNFLDAVALSSSRN
jgi:small-conductance mechanosensitive channel